MAKGLRALATSMSRGSSVESGSGGSDGAGAAETQEREVTPDPNVQHSAVDVRGGLQGDSQPHQEASTMDVLEEADEESEGGEDI